MYATRRKLIYDGLDESCDSESESEFDDDNIDPDFVIEKQIPEPDDILDGILAFETDSECEQVHVVRDNLDGPNIIEASDDDIEVSDDETDIFGGPSSSTAIKRSDPLNWTRNKEKKLRAEGKEFVSNTTNKLIKEKTTGLDCKCAYQCYSKINDDEKKLIINIFNSINSKEKQDTFLCGLISVNTVVRRRPKSGLGKSRSCSCKYMIRLNTKEVTMR